MSENKSNNNLDSTIKNDFMNEFTPIIEKRILKESTAKNKDTFIKEIATLSNLNGLTDKDSFVKKPERVFKGEPIIISIVVTNNYKVKSNRR